MPAFKDRVKRGSLVPSEGERTVAGFLKAFGDGAVA
jgi:hypothetical protein